MVVLVWEDWAFPRTEVDGNVDRLDIERGCITLMAVALVMLVLRPLPPPPPAHQPNPV